jgi:hypothetical protein
MLKGENKGKNWGIPVTNTNALQKGKNLILG